MVLVEAPRVVVCDTLIHGNAKKPHHADHKQRTASFHKVILVLTVDVHLSISLVENVQNSFESEWRVLEKR